MAHDGRVFKSVGGVLNYWRSERLELSFDDLVKKLKSTKIPLDYPSGPYGKMGYLDDDEISAAELEHWYYSNLIMLMIVRENGLSDIEFWALFIRDIATVFEIPTRQILSTPKGGVPANIKLFREKLKNYTPEQMAARLEVPADFYQEVEDGKYGDLERIGRVFTALARLTEEPIFNFFRPGHHIPRKSLSTLATLRANAEKAKIDQAKRNEAATARLMRMKRETEERMAARREQILAAQAEKAKEVAAMSAAGEKQKPVFSAPVNVI